MNSFPLGAAFCFQDWLPLVNAFACKGCEVCICGCQEPPPPSPLGGLEGEFFCIWRQECGQSACSPLPKWVGSAMRVWSEFSCGNQA